MKRNRYPWWSIPLALAILAIPGSAEDVKEIIESLPNGEIYWTQGLILAKGSGAPPVNAKVVSQARLMAERAAKADALRNLLETVGGVRVDSDTTVENLTTRSDVIRTRISGIVQGARVVDRRYLSDGGVEVTVAIDLTGELLGTILQERTLPIPSLVPEPAKPTAPKSSPLPRPEAGTPPLQKSLPSGTPEIKSTFPEPWPSKETGVIPPVVEEKISPPAPEGQAKSLEKLDFKKLEYSGLIIDARKLGLRPALIPKVLNQAGELVYSVQNVEQKELLKMGLVGYAKDVEAAAKNQRVTAAPYVITGLSATGEKRTDVVISNNDALVVLNTAPYTGYLKNGRVMIVYD